MPDATAPAYNSMRMIDDGERLAVHRVELDDAGAVVAYDPEPVTIEVASGRGINGIWQIGSLALRVAHATWSHDPPMLLRDGKLLDLAGHGGEDAEPARTKRRAIASHS